MTRILRAALVDGPISLTEHEDLVANDAAGAVVAFSGVVRNHDGGRDVVRHRIVSDIVDAYERDSAAKGQR